MSSILPSAHTPRYSLEWLLGQPASIMEGAILFWGQQPSPDGRIGKGCLSQWWPDGFLYEGRQYPTAEHWMMMGKAVLFDDAATAARILADPSPRKAKGLGRQVAGFDLSIWLQHAYRIVTEGSLLKFSQNPHLKAYLLDTGDSILVEASPYDAVWGIGMGEDEPGATDPAEWKGTNLLGFALMEARDILRQV